MILKFCFYLTTTIVVSLGIINGSAGTTIISTDKSMYQVIPLTKDQQLGFHGVGYSHPAIVLWTGIGKIGDPIQFLGTELEVEKFTRDILSPLGLNKTMVFRNTKVILSNEPIIQNKECNSNVIGIDGGGGGGEQRSPSFSPAFVPDPLPTLESELVPIQKIPNSSLFTGVYYRIRSKNNLNGLMVAHSHENTVLQDYNKERIANYKTPGKTYGDEGKLWESLSQWMFKPTRDPTGFLLDNRAFPDYFVSIDGAVVQGAIPEGRHVSMFKDRASVTAATQSYIVDAFWWKPILSPTEDSGKYHIIQNWSEAPSFNIRGICNSGRWNGDWQWVYFPTSHLNSDRWNTKGDDWHDSRQHEFMLDVTIAARIMKFEMLQNVEDILSQKPGGGSSTIVKETIPNQSSAEVTRTIENTVAKKSSFTFGFEQSFKLFHKIRGSVGIPGVASVETETGFEAELRAKQEVSTGEEITTKESTSVKVPPWSTVVVSTYSEIVKNIETPFNATVLVTGDTLRRFKDKKGEVTGPLSGQFILDYMKSKDTSYTRVQVLEIRVDGLVLNIRGIMRGNVAYRGIISTDEVLKPKETPTTPKPLGMGTTGRPLSPAEEAKKAYCST